MGDNVFCSDSDSPETPPRRRENQPVPREPAPVPHEPLSDTGTLSQHLTVALSKATAVENNLTSVSAKLARAQILASTCLVKMQALKSKLEDTENSLTLAHLQVLFLQSTLDYYELALNNANTLIRHLNALQHHKERPTGTQDTSPD